MHPSSYFMFISLYQQPTSSMSILVNDVLHFAEYLLAFPRDHTCYCWIQLCICRWTVVWPDIPSINQHNHISSPHDVILTSAYVREGPCAHGPYIEDTHLCTCMQKPNIVCALKSPQFSRTSSSVRLYVGTAE